jgi:hypothetical protein
LIVVTLKAVVEKPLPGKTEYVVEDLKILGPEGHIYVPEGHETRSPFCRRERRDLLSQPPGAYGRHVPVIGEVCAFGAS